MLRSDKVESPRSPDTGSGGGDEGSFCNLMIVMLTGMEEGCIG